MPSEKATIALEDIARQLELAQDFVKGMSFDAFENDVLHQYAVIRCLEIISEASRRLPDDLKLRHPHIAWREMAAAGNVYRHYYQGVTALRIWDTLANALPPLRDVVDAELKLRPDPDDFA